MTPNILFVGGGKGSWEIRGRQIAKALQARATHKPKPEDWRWADVVILVKRAIDEYGSAAKRSHVPIIWDVLDYWQQPEENGVSVAVMTAKILAVKARYGVTTVITATKAMADDLGGVYIPHHFRRSIRPVQPRDGATVVAYEGNQKYLGAWMAALTRECESRGMRFVVNPESICDADIVVSLRDAKWDGELCRRWKSGVKLVNAMCAGRPVITQPCSALDELDPVSTTVSSYDHVGWALEVASDRMLCEGAFTQATLHRVQYTVKAVRAQYRSLVTSALQVAA